MWGELHLTVLLRFVRQVEEITDSHKSFHPCILTACNVTLQLLLVRNSCFSTLGWLFDTLLPIQSSVSKTMSILNLPESCVCLTQCLLLDPCFLSVKPRLNVHRLGPSCPGYSTPVNLWTQRNITGLRLVVGLYKSRQDQNCPGKPAQTGRAQNQKLKKWLFANCQVVTCYTAKANRHIVVLAVLNIGTVTCLCFTSWYA